MSWLTVQAEAHEFLRAQPDRSVALVFFSPPYEDARTYGIDFRRKGQVWVDWLRPIIIESARVSNGLVAVNMAAKVEDHSYTAAVEWLVADLTRLDGLVCGPSPYAWVKSEDYDDADGNGTPGSGGKHFQRRDWEPIYTFCLPDRLPPAWSDNTSFGRPPKYEAGGPMSNRGKDGTRANLRWGGARAAGSKDGQRTKQNAPGPSRRPDGSQKAVKRLGHGNPKGSPAYKMVASRGHNAEGDMVNGEYTPPAISNAGNVIRCPVGGGKMGCPIAHDGEAPMSLGVAERFVCWFVPPGGVVLDPFCGTGTTGQAAKKHGRHFMGCDVRESQVILTLKRLALETPPLFA